MTNSIKLSTLGAFAALALGLVLSGCNSSSSETNTTGSTGTSTGPSGTGDTGGPTPGDKIKVGLVASLNGDLKPWGEDSEKGAKLAVEEINAAGGVNGKQIELVVEDSNSSPETGKTAAERLISKGCVAIVGEVASGITEQISRAAQDKKIPCVAVGATKTDITGIGDWLFRVCYTDDLQGPVMATFAYKDLGLRKVAIMTDVKQPYSTYLSKTFKESFLKQGGTIVEEASYESKQTQFSAQLTNIKGKNPDGLFLSGYFTEVGPIVRQAREAGITAKCLGGDGWDSAEILTSGGSAILGSYFCNHYNNLEDRAEVKEFLSRWDKAYKGPPGTTMGALGYDAIKLTADALKRAANPFSYSDVRTAIGETENFAGVSGIITLKGKGGNPDKRALVVELTEKGQAFETALEAKDVVK